MNKEAEWLHRSRVTCSAYMEHTSERCAFLLSEDYRKEGVHGDKIQGSFGRYGEDCG